MVVLDYRGAGWVLNSCRPIALALILSSQTQRKNITEMFSKPLETEQKRNGQVWDEIQARERWPG